MYFSILVKSAETSKAGNNIPRCDNSRTSPPLYNKYVYGSLFKFSINTQQSDPAC